LGVGISVFIYCISRVVKRKIVIKKGAVLKLALKLVSIILLIVLIVVNWSAIITFANDLLGFNILKYVNSELSTFNMEDVMSDRSSQAIITNTDNVFNILFGEGYGKYSPNNMHSIRRMPDASYYRLYNELGIIGTFLFFLPYAMIFINSVRKRNFFAIYFMLHTFIAFFFNRVLWAIPISYIIYPMFSFCNRGIITSQYCEKGITQKEQRKKDDLPVFCKN
jgi:hypothetical protein